MAKNKPAFQKPAFLDVLRSSQDEDRRRADQNRKVLQAVNRAAADALEGKSATSTKRKAAANQAGSAKS